MVECLLRDLEIAMADIGHQLKIKYGLAQNPSPDSVLRWQRLTKSLIGQGVPSEDAGLRAARQMFPDFQTRYYASEADTISYLLDQLGDGK